MKLHTLHVTIISPVGTFQGYYGDPETSISEIIKKRDMLVSNLNSIGFLSISSDAEEFTELVIPHIMLKNSVIKFQLLEKEEPDYVQ